MIRVAKSEDASDLASMLEDFNLEFGEPSPGEEFLASRVEALIDGDSKRFLIAHPGRQPAGGPPDGFAQIDLRPSVWSEGPVALLEELYVKPQRRGKGLGRELLDSVLGFARSEGAAMAEVITGEDDTAARGLYESFGFRNRVEGEGQARALYYELEL